MLEMWLLWILLIWWITVISPWFQALLELAQGFVPSLCIDLKQWRNWIRCSTRPFPAPASWERAPGPHLEQVLGIWSRWASPLILDACPLWTGWVLGPEFPWRPFFVRPTVGYLGLLRTCWPVSCSEAFLFWECECLPSAGNEEVLHTFGCRSCWGVWLLSFIQRWVHPLKACNQKGVWDCVWLCEASASLFHTFICARPTC